MASLLRCQSRFMHASRQLVMCLVRLAIWALLHCFQVRWLQKF